MGRGSASVGPEPHLTEQSFGRGRRAHCSSGRVWVLGWSVPWYSFKPEGLRCVDADGLSETPRSQLLSFLVIERTCNAGWIVPNATARGVTARRPIKDQQTRNSMGTFAELFAG